MHKQHGLLCGLSEWAWQQRQAAREPDPNSGLAFQVDAEGCCSAGYFIVHLPPICPPSKVLPERVNTADSPGARTMLTLSPSTV